MSEHSTIPSLVEYLEQIPEYRQARGKRHPLLALLLLICVATLCGAQGQRAIADIVNALGGNPYAQFG